MISGGYGSVVARIFNAKNDLVMEGVTRFRYVHSEVIDDASYITIETKDLTLADHPDLQDGKELKVVWGYLPNKLRAHLVWIWDITPTFSSSGLRMELKCYCKAAFLKLNSSQKVWEDKTLEDAVSDIAEEYGLSPGTEGIDPEDQSATPSDFEVVTTGPIAQPGILDAQTGKSTTAVDNTSLTQRYIFKKYGAMPQANKSDRRLLDDLASQEPVDNMFVNGRDDQLLVQRRNLNQKPYKSYILKGEPGYLLSFSPATKNSEGEKGGVANVVQGWDEENKEFIQAEITRSQSGAGVIGDMLDQSLEELVRRKVEEENDNLLDRRISVGGILQEQYDGVDGNGNPQYKKVVVSKIDTTKRIFVEIRKRGTRPSQVVFGDNGKNSFVSSAIDAVGRIENRLYVVKDPKEYLPGVESNSQDIAGVGVNRQSKKEMDLHSAEATILGDVDLQSSKVISINGVGKKYSGNYYIYHVSHDIAPDQGYICTLKLYRTGPNNIGSDIANKIDAAKLGLNKNTTIGLPGDGTERLSKVEITPDGPNEGKRAKPKRPPKLKGL